MGGFRQTWVKILIAVILVLVVGSTAAYLLGTRQNQPNAFSQPTPSLQVPTGTRFSPTIVQPSLTSLPTKIRQTASLKTYTNSKYKLSFDYPSNYSIGTSNDLVVLLRGEDKTHEIEIAFVSPLDNRQRNQTFSDFATEQAMEGCKASGVEGQSYCDKLVQQIPLQNPHGLTGYKYYFHWLHQKWLASNSTWETLKEATVGPVLAYDVSKQTNNAIRGVQILIAPLSDQVSSIDTSVLDSIGYSIRFLQ